MMPEGDSRRAAVPRSAVEEAGRLLDRDDPASVARADALEAAHPGVLAVAADRRLGGDRDGGAVARRLKDRWGVPAARVLFPAGIADLVLAVRAAVADGVGLRAVGSARSLSDVGKPGPRDRVVVMSRLDAVLPPLGAGNLYRAGAGRTIEAAVADLDTRGLAFANMGAGNFQTLLGAISTCTHGSGLSLPPFPSMVRAIEYVGLDAQGTVFVRRVEGGGGRAVLPPGTPSASWAPPDTAGAPVELVHDDTLLDALTVSLGALGIVFAVTLDVVAHYHLSETRTLERWSAIAPLLRGLADGSRHAEVLVDPFGDDCLVTRRVLAPAGATAGSRPPAMALAKTPLGRAAAGNRVREALRDPLGGRGVEGVARFAVRATQVAGYTASYERVLWLNLDVNAAGNEIAVPLGVAADAVAEIRACVGERLAMGRVILAGRGDTTA
jgi:FAD/FMN-containing dehydrogenase